jgi:hypothetical protein
VELTAKSLSELINSLRSNPRGASEKRTQPRVGLCASAEIVVRDATTGFGIDRLQIRVRDVSAGGIGLLCPRRFTPGEKFSLILDGVQPGTEQEAGCTVTYCRKVGTDLHLIGANFDGDPNANDAAAPTLPATGTDGGPLRF